MDEICPKGSYVNTHYVYIFQDLVAIEIELQFWTLLLKYTLENILLEYRGVLMASIKTDLVKISKCSRYPSLEGHQCSFGSWSNEAAAKGTDQQSKSGTGKTTLWRLIKLTINSRAGSLVHAWIKMEFFEKVLTRRKKCIRTLHERSRQQMTL